MEQNLTVAGMAHSASGISDRSTDSDRDKNEVRRLRAALSDVRSRLVDQQAEVAGQCGSAEPHLVDKCAGGL